MTLAPMSMRGSCFLLLALCVCSGAEVDDPRTDEFAHLIQKKFHLTSFSPPSGDSSPASGGNSLVPAVAPRADTSDDFRLFGLFGRQAGRTGRERLLASKWNLLVECVILSVPVISMLCIFAAKGGSHKADESTQDEAKALRSRSFGGLALLCAFLMFFGFLAHFKELIIDGVYRIHLGMPTLRVPAIHSMIALSWLILGCVQVASGVYGSQTDTHGWRVWHRRIGYVAAVLALLTASSGMIIDVTKNWQDLHIGGAIQGLFIMINMVAGIAAVRRRDFIEHKVFMFLAVNWTANVGIARPIAWLFRRIFDCPNGEFGSMFEVPVGSCASMLVLATLGWICEGKKTRRIIFFDFLCVVFLIIGAVAEIVNSGIGCEGMRHFLGVSW